MGFLLQLRILLWKNLTLKRRSPLVLLFELVIPLVLFVILLCIRYKQPAYAMPDSHTPTKPLPSAGILAVMQEFCAGGVYDNQRFRNFPKSTVNQFLQNFQSVAESNNFFDPGFKPSDLDHLPELYHRIIDDPAMLHDKIIQLQSLELNSLLLNMSDLVNELAMNLSIPADVTDSVLSSKLNVSEVYRVLFGDYSERRRRSPKTVPSLKDYLPLPEGGWKLPSLPSLDLDAMRTSEDYSKMASAFIDHAVDGKVLADTVRSYIPALSFLPDKGLLFQLLADNPQLLLDPEFRRIITGLAEAAGRNELDKYFAGRNPTDLIHLVQKMRLSSSSLHRWTCINDELSRLLLAASQKDALNVKYFNDLICSFPESKWSTLLEILKQHVSIDSDLNKLELKNVNTSVFTTRIQHFEDNLEKFLLFEKNLLMLSNFASGLPQTSCKGDVLPSNPSITLNVGSVDDVTTAYIDTTVFTTSDSRTMENSMNATTSDSSAIGNDNHGDKPSVETIRNAGLIRIWIAMQNTLCGFSTVNEENISKLSRDIQIDDLGLTQTQMNSIGMLVHALYSNPKVLYAPNNTAANIIMNKVNGTFELLDVITEFSRKWLKVSADIRAYLMLNKTENNIQEIVEMQRILRQLPVVLRMLHSQAVREFLSRPLDSAEANRTVFLHQLDVVDNAACSWISLVCGINVNVFQGFATEEELVNYFLHDAYSDQVTVLASVVFENLNEHTDTLPPHIIYKIRQNASFTDNTKFVRDKYWHPGPGDSSDKYYHFGFVWLQDMVERAIIDVQTGRDVLEPGTFVHQMPHPCYMEDRFLFMIEHVMPLCLTISWVYTVSMLVQSIVYEKEHRLKEVMRMMGLNNSVHWLAWFLTTFAQMSVTMAVLTVMLKYGNVLMYSNAFITFLVLEVFAVATIWFSFLVSACYSKAKVAAACAGILYFISYVPYMYVAIREEAAGDKISAAVKSLVSLLSTTAFGLGAKYFAFYEIEGVGVQWDNMAISPVEGDQYNLQLVILMMVFDALLYGLLTWYIENVHPGTIGLPKPWYFPFTKSYWFGCHGHGTGVEKHWWDRLFNGYTRLSVVEDDQARAMDDSLEGSHCNFESEPQHLFCGVHVNRLKKIYKKDKIAVNNLSFNLYEDQITSFLGHNGAGKTTTMSILTGLFPPTSGYATVYGLDIRSDMDEIRRNLGMCPQHNLLFDKLTVEEHLWLYARLKGMVASEIKTETDRMINDLGLPKKRHSSVDCLSGGMKRKLSVAIAFVAGSRTVILDEPTAGVDPYARRAIWDLIIKYKKGRTILLSTHHMDEADILGDRIAIISNGDLKCCGSSSFLKSTFGDGYHLVLVKKHSEEDLRSADTLSFDETRLHFHSRCCEEKLTTFISQYIQSAYVKNETNHELHYILPFDEAKKGGYERLFSALDASLSELHVASYGIADTNLEEVFLKITAESLPKANPTDDGEGSLEEVPRVPLSTSTTARQVPASDSDITSLQSHYLLDGAAGVELNRIGSVSVTSNNLMDSQTISYNELVSGVRDQPDVPLLIPTAEFRRSMDSLIMDCDEDVPLLVPECKSSSHKTDSNETRDPDVEKYGVSAAGGRRYRGHVLSGSSLYMQQFIAILIKRFYYIHRNWKGMFSQILLPAMFVSVAMTVALTAPQVLDLPAIVLSPAQYYNYTQPRGNFIPVSVAPKSSDRSWSKDASASDIAATFHLASGIGSTCVLKSPFNSSFDADILRAVNFTSQSQRLLEKYFNPGCGSVFVEGISLMNFVPPATVVIQPSSFKNDSILDVTSNPNRDKYHPECTCTSDHTGQICTTDGFELPPSYQAVTAEYVQDISGENEEEYYLTTQDMYRLHRYGAFSLGLAQESVPESFGKYGPTQFRKLAVRHTSMAWFDNKGYHSMPVYLNALNNAILRANLPKEKGNKAAYGITVINHPMNNTNNQLSLEYIKQGSDVLIAIFVICAMSFVPASFVVFLVYERSIKAKHLEIVSGLNRVIYWIANYVWDMFNYLIPGACCIIILKVFDIPAYVSSTNLPAVMALFLLYGWSITPMMYPASFIFNEPSTAYICLIVINLFIGMTCIITSFLLELFQQNSPDLAYIHDILKNVFLVFPNYCLGRGLMDIAFNEYRNEFFFKIGMYDEMKSPFEWKLTARNLVAMAAMGFVFFIITLLCEFNFFIKKRSRLVDDNAAVVVPNDEDADVTQERRRVLRGRGRHDLLQLKNLSKVYITRKLGQQQAVDHISLGVPAGECFGLLGVNGAGKTTTFRMLTGDLKPSGGDATLNGYSILKDIYKVQQNIGYCPQFDALYDELTAREHLQLYSRLRGIPRQQQSQVVDWALEKLGLTAYADKMSGTYSGGNKRKLSTAIALLGRPPIVFMDEPTTGMDPCSRRFLWNLIIDLIHEGTSVILTSHSMEECEVLCTRLAVMVNGRLQCLGSAQHLKNKYGDGYSMLIRMRSNNSERDVTAIKHFVTHHLPNARFKECHHNVIQYEFPSAGLSLAAIFSEMEKASRDLPIDDYSISQNTLDNVFINFVKQQQELIEESTSVIDIDPLVSLSTSHDLSSDSCSQPVVVQSRNSSTDVTKSSTRTPVVEYVDSQSTSDIGCRSNCIPDIVDDDEEDSVSQLWLDSTGVRLAFLNTGSSN